MKEQIREKLSALVDDELEPHEIKQLADRLAQSDELRGVWSRYQLISDAVRGETIDPRLLGVADRVREQVSREPAVLAPRPASVPAGKSVWVKPVAGAAIAASVAAAVLLLAPEVINRPGGEAPRMAESKAPDGKLLVPERVYAQQVGTRWDLGKPEVESKLNGYLVNHHKYAPNANMQGMLPYASFVGYDVER